MKLTCDICGGELEMRAGGQGAVCANCGLAYSLERLKEKLGVLSPTKQEPVTPVRELPEEEIIYDVTDYEVVDNAAPDKPCGTPQTPRELVYAVLVQKYGEKAVFPDAAISNMGSAEKVDFLVRPGGGLSLVIFIVSSPADRAAYDRAVKVGKAWENRGAYYIIFFENDCADPMLVRSWVYAAMEKAARIKSKQ